MCVDLTNKQNPNDVLVATGPQQMFSKVWHEEQHFGHQITFTVVLRTQGYDTFQLQWIESC